MISILHLPPPEDVWEGNSYYGVLYYHYPDASSALHYVRDRTNITMLSNDLPDTILDIERNKYFAPLFSFDGLEGEVIVFNLRAIRNSSDAQLYVEAQKVIGRMEDVKRSSITSRSG